MILDVGYVEDFVASNNGIQQKLARVVKIFMSVQIKSSAGKQYKK